MSDRYKTLKEMNIINDLPGFLAKDQPKWHHTLYYKWRDMWRRILGSSSHNDKYYKGCFWDDSLRSLKNFVLFISNDPLFEDFKENPQSFDIDKDSRSGDIRGYTQDTIILMYRRDNHIEALKRNNYNTPMPIIGIGNKIFLFKCLNDCKKFGFSPGGICSHLKGTYPYPPYKRVWWYKAIINHNKILRVKDGETFV